MSWGNQGINHYVYGAGTWSRYYWNPSYNPNATFENCMANCTTYAYGRVMENGLPAPVTRIRNANLWHTVVNTSAGWTLLNYSQGMSLKPGDILEWAAIHVAVVETYGTNPGVSGSWYTDDDGHSTGDRTTAVMGDTLASVSNWMVSHYSNRFYHYVNMTTENSTAGGGVYPQYVLRYNGSTPPEPGGDEEPEVTVSPSSYNVVMAGDQTYVDFTFNVTVTGIPEGYTASGSNTYPGLYRVYNTGWSYTDYTVDGTVYQRATKTQTLRYDREQSGAYTTTKYMYYSFDYPNGSASSTTPMVITVEASSEDPDIVIMNFVINKKKRKFHVKIF